MYRSSINSQIKVPFFSHYCSCPVWCDSQTFFFPIVNRNDDDQDKFPIVDTISNATVQYPVARANTSLPKKEIICIGRRKSSYETLLADRFKKYRKFETSFNHVAVCGDSD